VRPLFAVLALAALTAGCGSSGSRSEQRAPRPGSLEALWRQSGEAVALIPGTSDYSPGDVRVAFLVVDNRGRVVAPPTASVWVARSLKAQPFARTKARLENIGVPGIPGNADAKAQYVTYVHIPAAGTYYILARPDGRRRIGGIRELAVHAHSATPAVGARAYPSATPTLASSGGDLAKLTTRVPPDRALLRFSIAGSLRAHAPFVVTFATPRYCVSRTCGPVVDVVDHVRRRFARSDIRFIHVEIYANNDPRNGRNRWVREWHLPSEPWTFLVGPDGRIKTKFGGSVSVRELVHAIRANLH
jgi:hypothetical protein